MFKVLGVGVGVGILKMLGFGVDDKVNRLHSPGSTVDLFYLWGDSFFVFNIMLKIIHRSDSFFFIFVGARDGQNLDVRLARLCLCDLDLTYLLLELTQLKRTLNQITLVEVFESAYHVKNTSNIHGVGRGQNCLFGL